MALVLPKNSNHNLQHPNTDHSQHFIFPFLFLFSNLNTMKGRESKGPPSADLLVCFPTRAHLTLMPKPICSPARPSEQSTSHHLHPRQRRLHHPSHHHHLRKSSTSSGGHGSPLMWSKSNKPNNSDLSEPTSPKVTCAGQIKVRPKPNSCKNWQSVMEEIERLHNKKKKSTWVEALGFKKDVMQFLTCLRNIRFDFRCFGSFPTAEISSDDDDDDEDDHDDEEEVKEEINDQSSRAVFSKWFMILPENQESEMNKGKMIRPCLDEDEEDEGGGDNSSAPPNALLLMRCRSAPAKSWLEEKLEEEEIEKEMEIEKEKEGKQRLLVMTCGDEFSKLSADIAKETWVVGGINNMLSRSRSSKR